MKITAEIKLKRTIIALDELHCNEECPYADEVIPYCQLFQKKLKWKDYEFKAVRCKPCRENFKKKK